MESACPVAESPATRESGTHPTSTKCNYSVGMSLRTRFISQTWLNGHGYSINQGILTLPYGCEEAKFKTGDTFRQVPVVTTQTNKPATTSTVAIWPKSRILETGDKILILGYQAISARLGAVKTAEDSCPACDPEYAERPTTNEKIDNYTLSPECRGVGGDIGTFKTIRLR